MVLDELFGQIFHVCIYKKVFDELFGDILVRFSIFYQICFALTLYGYHLITDLILGSRTDHPLHNPKLSKIVVQYCLFAIV